MKHIVLHSTVLNILIMQHQKIQTKHNRKQNGLYVSKNHLFWGCIILSFFYLFHTKSIQFELTLGTNSKAVTLSNLFSQSAVTKIFDLQENTDTDQKMSVLNPLSVAVSSKEKSTPISIKEVITAPKVDKISIQQQIEATYPYVKRFANVAKAEMEKFGIPASIILAQGILESNSGKGKLATKNNNHFGMKCFSKKCKKGHCSNFSDDSHKDFFLRYTSAWGSYRDHSKLLVGKRYKHLLKLGTTDYKSWAQGLKKAGYATDKRYAEKIIEIIETKQLWVYDNETNFLN